jgi:hypothetical protein
VKLTSWLDSVVNPAALPHAVARMVRGQAPQSLGAHHDGS